MTFRRVKNVNDKDFREAVKIYVESFPPNERHSPEIIEKRIKENLYQMYVGHMKDRIVFMALLYPLKNTNFILFDYMATHEKFRNKGIGTNFVNYLLDLLKKQSSNKYLILEVEDPKYGKNKAQRERRVRFYKRLGAKEMKNVRYILPPLSGNIHTEMILMVLPEHIGGKIDGNLVKELVIQIYKELYNRNKDDALLNTFIYEIEGSVDLI